eukprot:COSAG05_NODE_689_length_7904_cov_97.607816_9_plen_76_part_00
MDLLNQLHPWTNTAAMRQQQLTDADNDSGDEHDHDHDHDAVALQARSKVPFLLYPEHGSESYWNDQDLWTFWNFV